MCTIRWKVGALIVLGVFLVACGNKGPLVLPDAGDDNKVENVKRELIN